jgi:hypothetical protein
MNHGRITLSTYEEDDEEGNVAVPLEQPESDEVKASRRTAYQDVSMISFATTWLLTR